MVFMKPGVDVQAVSDAVAGCAEAPDARLVRIQMMLGDGGDGGDGGGAGVRGDGASGGGGVGDGPEGGGKRRRIA